MSSLEYQSVTSMDKEDDNNLCEYAMELASASVFPMVLKAAIELGVLHIINGAGPGALISSSDIASQLPTTNAHAPFLLDRMLHLLASHSVLTCSLVNTNNNNEQQLQRLYGLAPVSKYFIPNQHGVSLASLLLSIQDKLMMDSWYYLKDAVLEGGLPFNKVYGMNASDYIRKDARYLDIFRASMSDYNSMFMKKILEVYKGFQGLKSLVDVGGGDGTILNMIISNYPIIKGINYDLAPIIEKSSPKPGIEHVAGDMFVSIPKGDAIFMKWMLHSFDDEHCIKLLTNCYEALPNNGKVMVVDLVVPETPESSVGIRSMLQFDLYMMNINPGGKERTEKELENLAKAAGFSSTTVACCSFNFSLVEFTK